MTFIKPEDYDENPKVYVANSSIHGYGVFARCDIAEDEYIGTYCGKKTTTDGMHVLWVCDEQTGESEGIDGSNEMRFLNHAKPGNAEFWDDELYSLCSISAGEEITFDYKWEESE